MKFKTLTIENFLAISAGEVELADRGLILIQGVNNDDTSAASVGAGKSSLADALCWCLYGVTARGVSGDAVVNETAGKGTRVEVIIQDGSDTYRIARHRKHKTGKNSLTVEHTPGALGSTPKDLTKGTDKLTQPIVDKAVGASLEVFRAAVYAGQELMPDLPAMTDKELKILIEEAAGVTLLEAAYREARDRLGAEKAVVDQLIIDNDKQADRLTIYNGQETAAKAKVQRWDDDLRTALEDLSRRAKEHVQKAKDAANEAGKFKPEADLTAEIAKIETLIAAVDHENTELDELNKLVSGKQSVVAVKTRERDQLAVRVRSAKTNHENITHRIGCPCDECGREITAAEIAAAEKTAKLKLTDEAKLYKTVTSELDAAQIELKKLTDERETYRATMTDVSAASRQRASLQAELDTVRRHVNAKLAEIERARTLGDSMTKRKVEKNPYYAEIEEAKNNAQKTRDAIKDIADKIAAQQEKVAQADAVVKVFSPAGVRAHILDEVTPYLNDRTSHYLSTLSDGNIEATWTTLTKNAKGEYKEKFSIEVVNDKGAQSFAGLSGGEKRKVRVSTALALQDLVATRASKQIDLFIGDEIDHALDEPGLERLTQILEEKAKERGSVFVISHNSLTDWISQVIVVKKNGKQAVIEEVTA